MNTPKLLVLALTAASLMSGMTALHAQTTPATIPAAAPGTAPVLAAPVTAPAVPMPATPAADAVPTPTVTAPTVAVPSVVTEPAAALPSIPATIPSTSAPLNAAPLTPLPTEPTAAGAMATAPVTMPIESNMVKPMVAEPVVDYSSQRAKPLPANTASLRNDRSAMANGKTERPARADRN